MFLGAGLVEGALIGERDFGLPGDADQVQGLATVDHRQVDLAAGAVGARGRSVP